MTMIEQLSYSALIRRLRYLAEAALVQYELGAARLSLLSHRRDTLFQVMAVPRFLSPEGEFPVQGGRTRFVLRLYESTTADPAMIRSELQWLTALRKDTGLAVPEPVLNREGVFLTLASVEDIPETRHCVLFHWVEGRLVHTELTAGMVERVGTCMARLHEHADHFVPSSDDFVRPRWEWQSLFGAATVLDPACETTCNVFSREERNVFMAVYERVAEKLRHLSPERHTYGLIHGDLQQTNYVFHKGEVGAIDFEDCCWGYYLYDMAVALSDVTLFPPRPQMQDTFLKGYTLIRPLPVGFEELLPPFTALCVVKRINALLHTNEFSHASPPEWLSSSLSWLRTFLDE